MSNARNLILAKLHQQTQLDDLTSPPVYQPHYGWSLEERILRFQFMLESIHGEVHRVTQASIQETVRRILNSNDVSKVLCSTKITHYFGDRFDSAERFHYDQPIEHWKPALFKSIDASITTTHGAIAETGTIVLWPDRDEPRLMSLVPPIHIAIVEAGKIYESFAEITAQQNWQSQMPTNALLISGPSKTADIEQILAYGIHGPRQLITLIIEP